MAWYIDEKHEVHRYSIASPTAIRLDCDSKVPWYSGKYANCGDHGKVIEEPNEGLAVGRTWAVDPEENDLLEKIDGKWIYRGEHEVGRKA